MSGLRNHTVFKVLRGRSAARRSKSAEKVFQSAKKKMYLMRAAKDQKEGNLGAHHGSRESDPTLQRDIDCGR